MKTSIVLVLLVGLFVACHANIPVNSTVTKQQRSSIALFDFDWHHVEAAYTVTVWIIVASIAKILFHVNKKFGDALPDSACLIVVGLILGYVLHVLHVNRRLFNLESSPFFLYLLPPIMFDAGYFMPNRQLFDNFDSVMLFAVVGTIMNAGAIGATLYTCGLYGLFSVQFGIYEIMLFASLISAVDPVAVIAVFEEIKVNEFLLINVFGEALFNDGITVVLYVMFKKFIDIGAENVDSLDYAISGASFIMIVFGGIFIGLVAAFIASFSTKYAHIVSQSPIAPVFIFTIPYMAYLTAEMFQVSSILAIVTCGIVMKEYVKTNITTEARVSVKYFAKMLAQSAELVIFMFLGLSTITYDHQWDTAFVIVTVVSCLVYRTLFIIIQCAILNRFRTKKFSAADQFVLSYGGLRGAIAFGLAVSMPAAIAAKNMFVTSTIAVIFFTVFVQGVTIRPLLFWLGIDCKADEQKAFVEDMYNRYIDLAMCGVEEIAGNKGRHWLREAYRRFSSEVLMPILTNKHKTEQDRSLLTAFSKSTLQEAMEFINKGMVPPHSSPHKTSTSSGSQIHPASTTTSPSSMTTAGAGMPTEEVLSKMLGQLVDKKFQELFAMSLASAEKKQSDIADNYIDGLRASQWSVDAKPDDRRNRSEGFVVHAHRLERHRSQPNVTSVQLFKDKKTNNEQ